MLGTEWLIKENVRQSYFFVTNRERRRGIRRTRPVQKGVFECSDERLDLAVFTETPPGIFQAWSNIGCKFNPEKWPLLRQSVDGLVEYAERNNEEVLLFVADHFSRSDNQRFGCRGHNCNLREVRASSKALVSQLERIYGARRVCVVHISIETDEGAILFHSDNGSILDMGKLLSPSTDGIRHWIEVLYYGHRRMSDQILLELQATAIANAKYLNKVSTSSRSADVDHRGWVLNVGQGSRDWLTKHNTALVVGPFDPKFENKVEVAGRILAGTTRRPDFDKNRGIVLLVSAPFRPKSPESIRRAEVMAMDLANRAMQALQPIEELQPYLGHLVVTVNMEDRSIKILDGN